MYLDKLSLKKTDQNVFKENKETAKTIEIIKGLITLI